MKTLKNLGLAVLALSLLAIPAAARNGQKGLRNNDTSKKHGQDRAEQVQTANNKGDKDNVPFKGSKSEGKKKKTRTRKGWHKTAEHNASGQKK